jgi:hypothetical protein
MPVADRRVADVGTTCWHDAGVRCWCRCILLIGSIAVHHSQAADGPSSNRQSPQKQIYVNIKTKYAGTALARRAGITAYFFYRFYGNSSATKQHFMFFKNYM